MGGEEEKQLPNDWLLTPRPQRFRLSLGQSSLEAEAALAQISPVPIRGDTMGDTKEGALHMGLHRHDAAKWGALGTPTRTPQLCPTVTAVKQTLECYRIAIPGSKLELAFPSNETTPCSSHHH